MPRLGRRKRWQHELAKLPALELVLTMWEDFWHVATLQNEVATVVGEPPAFAAEGAPVNAPRFRDFLLRAPDDRQVGALNQFFGKPITATDDMNVDSLPIGLTSWCWDSRRIYSIDVDLQAVLAATSVEDVMWSDVRLPFNSFAIQLARPIVTAGGRAYDFVLVSRYTATDDDGSAQIAIVFFSTKRNNYVPLSQAQLDAVRTLLRRGKPGKAMTLCYQLMIRSLECLEDCGIRCTENQLDNARIGKLAEYIHGALMTQLTSDIAKSCVTDPSAESQRITDEMLRVVVGFALYLKTLPPSSPHVSPPSKPFRSGLPDRKVITNRWEVCNVTSVIPLTREERIFYGIEGNQEEQRQAKYELGCHFREGHWRRPPGLGQDPTAPHTVHVRPTIVRRDRLPKDGGLPAGAVKGDLQD